MKLDGLRSRIEIVSGKPQLIDMLESGLGKKEGPGNAHCLWSYRVPLDRVIKHLLKSFPNVAAVLDLGECPNILVTIPLTPEEYEVLQQAPVCKALWSVIATQVDIQIASISNFLVEQEEAANTGVHFDALDCGTTFQKLVQSSCFQWGYVIPASIEQFVDDAFARAALVKQGQSARRKKIGWTVGGAVVTGAVAIGTTIATGGLAAPALAAAIWVGVKAASTLTDTAIRARIGIDADYHTCFVALETMEDAWLETTNEAGKKAISIGKSTGAGLAEGLFGGLAGTLFGKLAPSLKLAEEAFLNMNEALEASLGAVAQLPGKLEAVNAQMKDLLKKLPDVAPEDRDQTVANINKLLEELAALQEMLDRLTQEFVFWLKIREKLSEKLDAVKQASRRRR